MRICFILPSAYGYFNDRVPAVGGGARQLTFISRKLTTQFDVHFIVGDYGQPKTETFDGVTVHRAYDQTASASLGQNLVKTTQLARAMYRADADVYLYRGRPKRAAVAYLITRLLGRKWIYNLASDRNATDQAKQLPTPLRQLFKYSLLDAEAVIAQSETQSELLADRFNIAPTIIPSGYPAVDTVPGQNERDSLLWVGRLEEAQKRPHLFLDLAERLPDQEFRLVGPTGPDTQYNERIIERAVDLENVLYEGWVDPEEIDAYYQQALALVNTSAYEGFPSTFLEAWRYCTPVVSLSVDPGRYITPDIEGFADGDFEALVAHTETVATDSTARHAYAEPAHDYFLNNLTIDQVADDYAAVFTEV